MMESKAKKRLALAISLMVLISLFAGCSMGERPIGTTTGQATTASVSTANTEKPAEPEKIVEIEIYGNNPYKPVKSGDAYSNWVVEQCGVAVNIPTINWNGGTDYMQKLQLAIASNELPDIFLPWEGIEKDLIEQGAVVELTPYLEKYGKNILDTIPENVWKLVKYNDPAGKGGIYFIPSISDFSLNGEMIRKDWLDNVGLSIPKTQAEYVNVLKAFRDQDANKNGDPNDEIPTSGREQGRWMDHLFYMYGVAMWEGIPQWDIYDGEFTYSAVTPNMKAAIAFCRDLYAQKLLDNETFLNKSSDWDAKIKGDRVGSWFHIPRGMAPRLASMDAVNPNTKAELVYVPPVKVDGFDSITVIKQYQRPEFMIPVRSSEEEIIAAVKLINYLFDINSFEPIYYGVEGLDYKEENGKKVLIDLGAEKHNVLGHQLGYTRMGVIKRLELNLEAETPEVQPYVSQVIEMVKQQTDGRVIAGDGMPASVYGDYADLKTHAMYYEYMTHIIIGDWPLEKFDEFVEKWYSSGGEEVTKNAREWYEKVNRN